ncbi:hypothetical protein scyTo_0020385, partial [Scyliorhinus torazame]|nr:hypothetical protein [Scyliorhinus torazame]
FFEQNVQQRGSPTDGVSRSLCPLFLVVQRYVDINAAIQALIASNEALQFENYQNTETPVMDQGMEVFKTLHYLSSLMHSIKHPLGTKDHPVRVCRDLLNCESKLSNDKYWIDPNLGCPSDTIEVFCNFSAGGQTCLHPLSTTKLDFGIGKVQMNFLHLLSSEAVQTITIHCLNFPVWKNTSNNDSYANSMRFRGWNGQIFKANTISQPKIIRDGCKIQDGTWQQTQFLFHTQVVDRLPIVEIQGLPRLSPAKQYRVEIGLVCFL